MDGRPESELLRRLLDEAEEGRHFEAIYRLPVEPELSDSPLELTVALGIHDDLLSDTAVSTLAAINEITKESSAEWTALRWKLTAYCYLQDVFDAVLQPSADPLSWFQQYYFYYESRLLLAESVLAGLNGLYVASIALLRPFLEFTLLQNYYYRLIRSTATYAPLEQYFKSKKHPSWNTILQKTLPSDSFCRPIKFRLLAYLSGLSESAAHPYHPDHSPLQHRHAQHGHSLEGIFFWLTTSAILDAALWTYYVNFPLLFHPVDVLRKFGLNGPVGIVVDAHCGHAVRASVSQDDYRAFLEYSAAQDVTRDVLEWANSRPDLTDDEIRAMWNADEDGPWPGAWKGYGLRIAKLRALRAAMAFRHDRQPDVPDELINDAQSLAGWKRISHARTVRGRR